MTQRQKALLSCAVAAALLLSGCRKGSSDSGSMSSSNAMSGSSGSASTTQTGGWKTGLGILTEASDDGPHRHHPYHPPPPSCWTETASWPT